MNLRLKSCDSIRALFLVLALWFPTASARGQDKPLKAGQTNSAPEFVFNGNTLIDFVHQVESAFHVELSTRAAIPENCRYLRLPRMSMKSTNWADVLYAYNALSRRAENSLGSWIIAADDSVLTKVAMQAVYYMPPTNANAVSEVQVRAFNMHGVSEVEMDKLLQAIFQEKDRLALGQNLPEFSGSWGYNKETELLIVTGGKNYVALVEAVLQAYKERSRIQDIKVPAAPNK